MSDDYTRDPSTHEEGEPQTGERAVSYEELVAYLDGDLDELTTRRLRARIALDPDATRKIAALDRVDQGAEQLRAEHARRRAAQPDLDPAELEMSDESTDRIAAAIKAEVAHQQAERGRGVDPDQP